MDNLVVRIPHRAKGSHPFMAVLLGLLSANNVIYTFVVGSTPIMLISVYSLLALCWLFLVDNGSVLRALCSIPVSLWVFFLCVFLSVVPVAIFHPNNLYQWMVGVIDLFLFAFVVLLTVALKNNISEILKGICLGIVINVLIVLYAYFRHNQGVIFSLQEVFPAANIRTAYISNSFRGDGLFKEPGHLMRYLAVFALLLVGYLSGKKGVSKYVVWIAALVIMAFSVSASLIIFAVGVLVYIVLSARVKTGRTIIVLLIVGVVLLGTVFLAKSNSFVAGLLKSFVAAFQDTDTETGGNADRLTGMMGALQIIKEYFGIGCGWNLCTTAFREMGFYTSHVKGTYSEFLSLIAELGLGVFTFLGFLFSSFIRRVKSTKAEAIAMACSILIYFLLFSFTDYGIDGGSAVFIGIVIASKAADQNSQQAELAQGA